MIVVRLVGRMGNQLFQYAFALSVQKRFRTLAIIDDRLWTDIINQYFSVKGIFHYKLVKRIIYKFNKAPEIYQEGNEDVQTFLSTCVKNSINYYAYFQSEAYFSNIKDTIRERFRIKRPFKEEFQRKYGALFSNNKILAIHYRIGDYVNWNNEDLGGGDFTLPESYYKNALAQVSNLDDYLVVLVTDDIRACDSRTSYLTNKKIISDTEIMDFQIFMNADKLIIANSSFSWWGAYLNAKKPVVYAPEFWLGFKVDSEFPNGIIPESFVKVKV
jgi:hypothetical protein